MSQSDLFQARRQPVQIRYHALRAAFFLLVFLSLFPRLVDYDATLLGPHFFRQTQTAATIWSLLEHSFSPFNYQTPLFGPPWQVPFEFPLFQMTAAALVRLGVSSIDVAARFTNLFYFYLSAAILHFLSRRYFDSAGVARFVVLLYVWCPFNIMWSRTCMIDFSSVSFALAYLYCFDAWLKESDRKINWRLAPVLLLGVLGYLTKSTTMPTVLVPVAYLSITTLFPSPFQDSFRTFIRRLGQGRGHALLGIGVAVLLPALCGMAWVRHTDAIKEASPFTTLLVSSNLVGFLSGPMELRLNLENWEVIFNRLTTEVLPYFSIFLVPIGILAAYRHSSRSVDFVYTMLFGSLITVSLFFHAYYVHDYYLMAITANLSVVAGVGAHYICVELARDKPWLSGLLISLLLLSYSSGLIETKRHFDKSRENYAFVLNVSDAVRGATEPDEYVAVKDFGWNSGILYYARRKGFMLRPSMGEPEEIYRLLKEQPFTTIVYKEYSAPLLNNWQHHREVTRVGDWRITKVSDDPSVLDALVSSTSGQGGLPAGLGSVSDGETRFVINIVVRGRVQPGGEAVKIPLAAGDFMVSGWAVDEAARGAPSGVYLEIDGRLYEPTFPIEREDVAQYFRSPAYTKSGYRMHFHTSELGKGRHVVSVKILTTDGTAHYAPETTVSLDIE